MSEGIAVDLTTILTVTGAILTPLLAVIAVLWKDRVSREEKEDARQREDRLAYDAMRDRMQEKIDASNKSASDAVNMAAQALNSMKDALSAMQATQLKQGEQWPIFKQELIDSVTKSLRVKK